MNRASLVVCVAAGLIALSASEPAFSAISDTGLLDDVTTKFLTQSSLWGATITNYATYLFWLLATISMVWTFGILALRKADIGDFFSEFFRFTVTTGFFWWLLSNGPTMAIAIIDSLREIGATAGGIPVKLTPSTPISIGFDIVKKAFSALSWVNPVDNLAIVFVCAAVVVAMAIVAANVLIALVTAWTMAYAGTFILGFGGSRWTSDMAIGYFKAMLGIGLELMTMTLLIGIATSVIDGFYNQLDGSSVYDLLLVFCVCAVLALLIDKIPGRVAALASSGSGASVSAGVIIGAAAGAAAAAATGGAAVAAAGANIAGGAQALQAAFTKAAAAESAGDGGGDFLSAASSAGGGGDNRGGSSASASGSGGSPLASVFGDSPSGAGNATAGASNSSSLDSGSGSQNSPKSGGFAKAGRIAAGTAANLAKGTLDVAKAKVSNIKDSALDRISETTGGQIAAAIKVTNSSPETDATENSHDSLILENFITTGSSEAIDPASEVAAFVNKPSGGSAV